MQQHAGTNGASETSYEIARRKLPSSCGLEFQAVSRSDPTHGTMKEPDPLGDFKKLLLRKNLEEIVAMPAILYFPTGIVAQLDEICRRTGTLLANLSLELSRARSTTRIDS